MMRRAHRRSLFAVLLTTSLVGALASDRASADLLLYDPFDYTAGANLGGTDPDGAGPTAGTPIGQTNLNTGGGTWFARSTQSNYQSPNDIVIGSGSLSYPGLATGAGNSVTYGSDVPNSTLYANSIDIPGDPITTGSVYASFIIRIKSHVSPSAVSRRHSPAAFVADTSDPANAGLSLDAASGFNTTVGAFWMRRDPAIIANSNFSPGKSSGDGTGPGAAGATAGWQDSRGGANIESNQFGDVDGQVAPSILDSGTYQTYFVVLKYEFDAQDPGATGQADTISLWMNPGSGTLGLANGESLASQNPTGNVGSYYAALDAVGTATSDAPEFESFALIAHRQNTDQSIAVDFDELRIGTTWADVTPAAPIAEENADFDGDGDVDGADFLTWQRHLGAGNQMQGDADGNGTINNADLDIWKVQYGASVVAAGAVPEPATYVLALAGLLAAAAYRSRREEC